MAYVGSQRTSLGDTRLYQRSGADNRTKHESNRAAENVGDYRVDQ